MYISSAGVYNFTVVTGLYDIGRGKWKTQSRTYSQYLGYLSQVTLLLVALVTDKDSQLTTETATSFFHPG